MAIPPRWRGSSFGGCSPFTCYGSSWSRCSSWCSCRWTSSVSRRSRSAVARRVYGRTNQLSGEAPREMFVVVGKRASRGCAPTVSDRHRDRAARPVRGG